MSILFKFNNCTVINKQIIKNTLLKKCILSYSRRSNSKFDSCYKIVKSKVRPENGINNLLSEGEPNWEFFGIRGNRFYLPGSIGPAWQGATTTIKSGATLENLIDFDLKELTKLSISVKKCPKLIKSSLHELFPAPEVVTSEDLTLITLKHRLGIEYENGARAFVLAAREMCSKLRLKGYWADFMNPFSGKPFYSYARGKKLYKIDARFRGLGMRLKRSKNCIIISTDNESAFSGSIFTNAPSDFPTLQNLMKD